MKNYIALDGTRFDLDELLSCPCCGGKSRLLFKGRNKKTRLTLKYGAVITCTKCLLTARTHTTQSYEVAAKQVSGRWNTRV